MTSKLTREQLIKKAQEQIAFCRDTKVTGEGRAHVDQCAALFEIALAAMDNKQTDELVMWVKRLAHSLRKASPDSKLQNDAMDYLSRKGLISAEDVLR
ncbi:hypothetical protein [Klebsiella oxytoca]|uniref:hypothetical protein n=1 Tax=Klebsiella oxytoca TaxID=571 RepID=UPI001B8253CF|nr:hypothetical protein [Klebsiella oxytoca]MBR7593449.1 hypothetical protein [Klebsiella oxytoca]HBC6987130.1 hypothetical protein [Klebsiella oxytoca]